MTPSARSHDASSLPGYEDALQRVLEHCDPCTDVEERSLDDADGMVLATPVVADRHLPPFNRAQMDGYALRAVDYQTSMPMNVVANVPAGSAGDVDVPRGCCTRIATGAPVPSDLDTVVPHEWSDRGNPVRFHRDPPPSSGHAIHPLGADASEGTTLVEARTVLQPQHVALAAAVGHDALRVIRPPSVRILTSGDEIKPVGAPVQTHQIRNSNAVMLKALFNRMGAQTVDTAHCLDDESITRQAVHEAIAVSDVVVTVGGVSAGERDFFPSAFDACDVTRFVSGAAIQPGKPIVIGKTPTGTFVIGLPGNPVSALVTACLFGWPLVRRLRGERDMCSWRDRPLAHDVKPNPRRAAFRPCSLTTDERVDVPRWAGSGDLAHTTATTGFVALPMASEPVPAGTLCAYHPWP